MESMCIVGRENMLLLECFAYSSKWQRPVRLWSPL